MKMNNDITKFEFLLTLSGNIVVQRYFSVMDYNPEAKDSLDMYHQVTHICDEISNFLKIKTLEYLDSNQNIYPVNDNSGDDTKDKNEHFLVEIKLDNQVFIQRIFPAYVYPPKVRYAVDIRPLLRGFLDGLAQTLSSKRVIIKYLSTH